MHTTFRKRKKPVYPLVFAAFILLAIPIAVYSLLSSLNFDIRHLAYEETYLPSPCTIHIPYVNSRTLAIDNKYQIHVYTYLQREKVESIKIHEKNTGELFSKEYRQTPANISETFAFSPNQLGKQNIYGEIQTTSGTYECKMDREQTIVYVIEENHPPEFLTDPYYSAKPRSSALSKEETYEYTLEVADRDLDQIEYHYSFTPRAHWLHKTVLESGKDGRLKIRFSGTPDRDGSYLANIFVHDGHNKHLSAQSWVISVGQESTDIPVRDEPKYPLVDFDFDFDNEIILLEPQIAKILPRENTYVTNPRTTISANLIASHNSTIDEDSVVFKLNNSNLTKQADFVQISKGEILLRYTPEKNLETGEYRVYIYFEDSMGNAIDREWTFTLQPDLSEENFLGIPITTFMIFSVGTLLVIFALSIPWVIYIAWKKDQPQDYEEITIIKPEGESSYKKSFEKKS